MKSHFEDQEIRRYLLGEQSEADETAIESAYFDDPVLLARVETMEHDLADDDAAGRLSAADRHNFHRRLLATREGREDGRVTRAIRSVQAGDAEPANVSATTRRVLPAWLQWAAVAVLIVGGAAIAWQFRSAQRDAPDVPALAGGATATPDAPARTAPSPGTAVPKPVPTPAPSAGPAATLRIATLILTGELSRGDGEPATLIAGPEITHVDVLVPATDAIKASARGRVETIEGTPIWTGSIERVSDSAGNARARARARARIPITSLPPGDYFFAIVTGSPDDPPAYYFRVRPRP